MKLILDTRSFRNMQGSIIKLASTSTDYHFVQIDFDMTIFMS